MCMRVRKAHCLQSQQEALEADQLAEDRALATIVDKQNDRTLHCTKLKA